MEILLLLYFLKNDSKGVEIVTYVEKNEYVFFSQNGSYQIYNNHYFWYLSSQKPTSFSVFSHKKILSLDFANK